MRNFEPWYDKNYKKLLIAPIVVLTISLIFLAFFYSSTGDIIHKDVSLTGGTTITISTEISQEDLESFVSKTISDFEIKKISDNSGKQTELIITVGEDNSESLEILLEEFLGYELDSENSSRETTSASLSSDFYKQLIVAIILAFFWMAAVVYIIFKKGGKTKAKIIFVNILFGFFMGNYFLSINKFLSGAIFLTFATYLISNYIKNSVPAFAVMFSAFADIVMTLAVVDLIGMKISTAGIVAFLMLIGYSVDTDILLTTRMLKLNKSTNSSLFSAFKTGTTMTLTSIIAVSAALIVISPFSTVLNQIFIILLIGLAFDLLNTWITNASIIKWYVSHNHED